MHVAAVHSQEPVHAPNFKNLICIIYNIMGITWSHPKPVSDATKIMMRCSFPTIAITKSQLWNLWKQYKASLKQDGFRISKYNNIWYIFYFTDVTDDSYNMVDSPNGRIASYMAEFKNKYAEWKLILDELNSVEHITDARPSEETWFHDMEHDPDL